MSWLTDISALSMSELWFLLAVSLVAGLVRGFTGFGLSAVAMAAAVVVIPPISLIPILWVLELSASAMMIKSNWQEADKSSAFTLWSGTLLGLPIGLYLTTSLPEDTSRLLALCAILTLGTLQLFKVRITVLDTKVGKLCTGLMAGIATGIANIGGMMMALYVLSSQKNPRQMRALFTMLLTLGAFTSLLMLLLFQVMTLQAMLRGIILIPSTILGITLGSKLFSPRFEAYYHPICLTLIITIAAIGITKLV